MHDKHQVRRRRARKTSAKIRQLGAMRLSVHRTSRHIYVRLTSPDGSRTLVSASSLDKELRANNVGYSGNVQTARLVGEALAERALKAGIGRVAFDRAGFKYHGRVKALAEAARGKGMEF